MPNEKDKNLILHICNELADDDSFGVVKLNKALYFIDITSYMLNGEYVSSFKYIKQQQGPTPDGAFMELRKELIKENKLRVDVTDYYIHKLKKPVSLVQHVDMSSFSPNEIDIITTILRFVRKTSATELSHATHNLGWKRTSMMGELGVKTYLFSHEPLAPVQRDFFIKEVSRFI